MLCNWNAYEIEHVELSTWSYDRSYLTVTVFSTLEKNIDDHLTVNWIAKRRRFETRGFNNNYKIIKWNGVKTNFKKSPRTAITAVSWVAFYWRNDRWLVRQVNSPSAVNSIRNTRLMTGKIRPAGQQESKVSCRLNQFVWNIKDLTGDIRRLKIVHYTM